MKATTWQSRIFFKFDRRQLTPMLLMHVRKVSRLKRIMEVKNLLVAATQRSKSIGWWPFKKPRRVIRSPSAHTRSTWLNLIGSRWRMLLASPINSEDRSDLSLLLLHPWKLQYPTAVCVDQLGRTIYIHCWREETIEYRRSWVQWSRCWRSEQLLGQAALGCRV